MTDRTVTVNIMVFSIANFSTMTLSITTLSTATLNIITRSLKTEHKYTQHNDTQYKDTKRNYTQYHRYELQHIKVIGTRLSVVTLNAVLLIVVAPVEWISIYN
jgi:hypothetical protein